MLKFPMSLQLFNGKPHLSRHLTAVHGYRPPSPRKLKPRSPFYMKATELTKIARRLCAEILNGSRAARAPSRPLLIHEIKAQCRHFFRYFYFGHGSLMYEVVFRFVCKSGMEISEIGNGPALINFLIDW